MDTPISSRRAPTVAFDPTEPRGTMSETIPRPLKVVAVEDDARTASELQLGLARYRVLVQVARTLAEATHLLAQAPNCDALVLDLNLPDGNGLELARKLRAAGSTIPIIMVTARDGLEDRIAGLRHGADDYVCKPFAVEELAARLEAVVRRTRRTVHHVLRYGDIELDLLKRQVRRGGEDVPLSSRELDLLVYFMCRPEEVLDKEQILRNVWGDDVEQDANVLHVYANYVRNKLERGRFPRVIHTVRGVGYVLSRQEPTL